MLVSANTYFDGKGLWENFHKLGALKSIIEEKSRESMKIGFFDEKELSSSILQV